MQDNNKLKVVRSALNCIRLFLLYWVMLQKLNSSSSSSYLFQVTRKATKAHRTDHHKQQKEHCKNQKYKKVKKKI